MPCYDKYRTSSMRKNNGLEPREIVSKHESPKDTQLIFRIEEGLKDKAQAYAAKHGITLSELVRGILIEAVNDDIGNDDEPVSEQFEVRDPDEVSKEAERRVMAKLREQVRLKKEQAAKDKARMDRYIGQ